MEVMLLAPVRAVARVEGEDVARRRAAPSPTTRRTGVMHFRRAPAYTYEIEGQVSARGPFASGLIDIAEKESGSVASMGFPHNFIVHALEVPDNCHGGI
jgi:hypothetical protein